MAQRQIVTLLEKDTDLNCLEVPDALQFNTVGPANMPVTRNPTNPNRRDTTVKYLEITKTSVANWKDRKSRLTALKIFR